MVEKLTTVTVAIESAVSVNSHRQIKEYNVLVGTCTFVMVDPPTTSEVLTSPKVKTVAFFSVDGGRTKVQGG